MGEKLCPVVSEASHAVMYRREQCEAWDGRHCVMIWKEGRGR
jgi:hypothetical protein